MINLESKYPLLATINSPKELRLLSEADLPLLAQELRHFIIDTLNQCGGHFAGNLGTVELAIALHYVFNTPEDQLIWDVGHQAYPHKVLTERRDQLYTIRQTKGLAPFNCRSESPFDAFTTGHSSTSISAATGMAVAAALDQSPQKAIAIIGDGGLTGGMAFEALNHAGSIDANVLVVLNDNEMSISRNVGALTNYLARILSGPVYTSIREQGKKVLNKLPAAKEMVKRTETHVKGMMTPGTIFEELGFHYFGPVDGHDLKALIPMLKNLQNLKGPQLLHIVTAKGKGYAPAEADPIKYHAVKSGFNEPSTQTVIKSSEKNNETPKKLTYSEIFGQWLCDMAAQDPDLIAITPAMCEGSGMTEFAKQFPERYHDVGIAEQHCVTFGAGIACTGKKPVVAIYSTFLQRAYDQLIHDVCLPNLNVMFALDRAGLVGDGPTHAGIFDISFLRCVPNLIMMAPADENECRQMLYTAYQHQGPSAVRYPRGIGPGTPIQMQMQALPLGKGVRVLEGKKIAILAFGSLVETASQVGKTLGATVVNMRFIKPLDTSLIAELAQDHQLLVTLEEHVIMGGAGSAVNEFLMQNNLKCSILNLGLPDEFPEHGNPDDILKAYRLDAEGVTQQINSYLQKFF
jgi:1-deoxy-D-xylulose-5-phosphate synthase